MLSHLQKPASNLFPIRRGSNTDTGQRSMTASTVCTKRAGPRVFGPEVKRRIMLGSFVLSSGYYDAYYLKALRTKALIKQAFDKAFSEI